MEVTFGNKIIIPASENRVGVVACIFDTKTGEYTFLPTDKCPEEQKKMINKSKGTLLMVHKPFGICGVLKDVTNRSKPMIIFYRECDLENKSDTILNFRERSLIEDISDKDIDFIKNLKDTGRFNNIQFIDSSLRMSSFENFKKCINLSDTVDSNATNIENTPNIVKDDTASIEEEKDIIEEEQADKDMTDYKKALDRLDEITLRLENSEREKQEEIARLKNTFSRINVDYDNELSEKLVDVVDIGSIHEQKRELTENSAINSTYELILKVLKENDSVAIPMNFYKSLITSIRKNLFHNMSFTVYNALVYIRFDRTNDKFIFARVDYNESLDDVRINILKPYNNIDVSDNQIIDYEIKYNQWRKYNSFTNN